MKITVAEIDRRILALRRKLKILRADRRLAVLRTQETAVEERKDVLR